MQQAVSLPRGEGMETVVRMSCTQKAVVFNHIAPESITCCMENCITCQLSSHCLTQWQRGLPVEVLPFAYKPVKLKLAAMGGTADLRMAKQKAVCLCVV